jgi:phosphatidylserine decarboxylase
MAQNERVVFHLRSSAGAACLVMVAALGVSNMEVACDRMETRYLRASQPGSQPVDRKVRFDQPIDITRGEELGAFHLGSTTIIIFAPGSVSLDSLRVGDIVRFGQPIGRRTDRTSRIEPVGTIG